VDDWIPTGAGRRPVMMTSKVCKFGGTSLADAQQMAKVLAIVQADPARRYVVPSAPGKRRPDDRKITDVLYLCHQHARQGLTFDDVFGLIANRFEQIISDLELDLDLAGPLEQVKKEIAATAVRESGRADYAASRGEYLSGLVIARLLNYPFVDPAELIFFDQRGRLDESKTYATIKIRLADMDHAVIPGFYGSDVDGQIKTFSRGGSDITGAVVARALGAAVYENWTDVSGLLMADPRIVDKPRTIETITYRELRELSYMGATVLHEEAVFPVRGANIPVNIRNTNDPQAAGTTILASTDDNAPAAAGAITGIAGRKDFTIIAIEKAMMNSELGFGRRVLNVLEVNDVNFEHMPSGIDTMSLVIADSQIDGKLDTLLDELRQECKPDALEVVPNVALIATVGRGMAHRPGMAARLFDALAQGKINIRMIDQGSSELNIIVGVEANDFADAVRAIYAAFVD
jgi:aspartate kinase